MTARDRSEFGRPLRLGVVGVNTGNTKFWDKAVSTEVHTSCPSVAECANSRYKECLPTTDDCNRMQFIDIARQPNPCSHCPQLKLLHPIFLEDIVYEGACHWRSTVITPILLRRYTQGNVVVASMTASVWDNCRARSKCWLTVKHAWSKRSACTVRGRCMGMMVLMIGCIQLFSAVIAVMMARIYAQIVSDSLTDADIDELCQLQQQLHMTSSLNEINKVIRRKHWQDAFGYAQ